MKKSLSVKKNNNHNKKTIYIYIYISITAQMLKKIAADFIIIYDDQDCHTKHGGWQIQRIN